MEVHSVVGGIQVIDNAYPYPDDNVYSATYGFDIVKVTTFLAESLEHDDLVGHGTTEESAVNRLRWEVEQWTDQGLGEYYRVRQSVSYIAKRKREAYSVGKIEGIVGHGMTPTEAVEDIKRQLTISDIITDYKEPT
jgi:hypothetical protein